MTPTTIVHSAGQSDAIVCDPTQRVRDLDTCAAERDPTAGAPHGVLHDPTSPGAIDARAIVGPGGHAPSPSHAHKPVGHVVGHALGDALADLRFATSLASR
jgi:hypothetical protein